MKVFPRRKHAAAQEFFSAAAADLLRPIHPTALAQAEEMPRIFIGREAEVVQPEQHHARSPVRPVERGLSRQRKIRDPFGQPRTDVRPPQRLSGILPIQRGDTALGFQHFACAAINFPANIKRQLRLDAHLCTSAARASRDSFTNALRKTLELVIPRAGLPEESAFYW